jgi:hypothetical protein
MAVSNFSLEIKLLGKILYDDVPKLGQSLDLLYGNFLLQKF